MKVADNMVHSRIFQANHSKNQRANLKKFYQIFGEMKNISKQTDLMLNEVNKKNDKITLESFAITRLRK